MVQPAAAWPAIRVSEHHYFKLRWKLLDSCAQVVHFLAAALRLLRDDHVSLSARCFRHALDGAVRGIGSRCQDEKHLVILVIELREGNQIAFEARFDAFARTEYGDTRSVESRIGSRAATREGKPLHALPDHVHTREDLGDHQKIENGLHAGFSITNAPSSHLAGCAGRIAPVNLPRRERACQDAWIWPW